MRSVVRGAGTRLGSREGLEAEAKGWAPGSAAAGSPGRRRRGPRAGLGLGLGRGWRAPRGAAWSREPPALPARTASQAGGRAPSAGRSLCPAPHPLGGLPAPSLGHPGGTATPFSASGQVGLVGKGPLSLLRGEVWPWSPKYRRP